MNAMLEASMVVARIQGAAFFAHAGPARAAESVTRSHGSDDTVDIYLPAVLGRAFGIEAITDPIIIQSATKRHG
jgi:hypothetical protein